MTELRDEPTVPQDVEAEGRLLGTCLLDANASIGIVDKHDIRDFHYKPHAWVFNAIGAALAANEPITPAAISRRLAKMRAPGSRKDCLTELGGESYLFGLLSVDVSESGYWSDHVKRVRKARDLFRVAERARDAALKSPDIDAAIAEFETELVGVAGNGTGSLHIADGMDLLRDRILKYVDAPGEITGFQTGWADFDAAFDGIQRGSVTLVYGPTGRGKSLFTQNMLWRFARSGIPVLLFSTEMPRLQVDERLMQLEAGLNLKWLKEKQLVGEYLDQIAEADTRLRGYPIFQNDSFELDIQKVTAEIARQVRWNGVGAVFLDLIDGITTSKYEGIPAEEYISSQLKACGLKHNVALIGTAHTNKAERIGDPPVLPSQRIKGAASKAQDADNLVSCNFAAKSFEPPYDWYSPSDEVADRFIRTTGTIKSLLAVTKARNGERPQCAFETNWNEGGRMEEIYL